MTHGLEANTKLGLPEYKIGEIMGVKKWITHALSNTHLKSTEFLFNRNQYHIETEIDKYS